MRFGFQAAENGLDGGTATELVLDDAEHAALLPGDKDAARVLHIATAMALVDVSRCRAIANQSRRQPAPLVFCIGNLLQLRPEQIARTRRLLVLWPHGPSATGTESRLLHRELQK